eukprot:2809225-Rhodomonas_salina.1
MVRMIRSAGIMRDSCFRKFGHKETVIPVEFKIRAALFWMGHGGSTSPGPAGRCASEQSSNALAAMNSWKRRCRSMLCLLVNADTKTGTLSIRVTEA